MQDYIGIKRVTATPMTRWEFLKLTGKTSPDVMESNEAYEGYKVVYEGGYESWCPKEEFESANVNLVLSHFEDMLTDKILTALEGKKVVDGRWLSIARTHIEQGLMAFQKAARAARLGGV